MIIAHYAHRLPADYDISAIRDRAQRRGALWNDVPDLYFKGFLLREAGNFGAKANSYSSLYLWRQDDAFRDFLASGRYKVVTDSFGRAAIQTRIALDGRRGGGEAARFALRHDLPIPLDADLTDVFAEEIERNRNAARQPGNVAAAVGVDTEHWSLTRIALSEQEPGARENGAVAYEVLHLARPLLDRLPTAGDR